MRRYNLIDEKWIPLRMLDGSHTMLGIADTLIKAKEIEAIEDQSPFVVAAIYRFLLAILYRSLEGPTDIDQAKILFKEGLPTEKIESYLTRWRDRFWLFDEKYPFGQIPSFEPKKWRTWAALTAECNADNAKVIFDHVDIQNPGKISEAQAICRILAIQTFALGGGKSDLVHTSNAPSAKKAMMVLPMGSTLEETLLFSLIPENREIIKYDLPIWEREPELINAMKSQKERGSNGFADLYTWRSRAIRLEDTAGSIERVAFASGGKHKNSDILDPMLAYKKDDKYGLLPIPFPERGLWRDFDCILPDSREPKLAPQVMQHAISISNKRLPKSIMVFGLSNNKAQIKFWRIERFILPSVITSENTIRSDIGKLLKIAEDVQKFLMEACKLFARHLLRRGEKEPEKSEINAFINQMACVPLYWSTLEAKFHDILASFSVDKDADEIEYEWRVAVANALSSAWDQHKSTVLGGIWEIRAFVKADNVLLSKLTKFRKTIKDFKLREVK